MTPPGPVTPDSGDEQLAVAWREMQRHRNDRACDDGCDSELDCATAVVAAVRPLIEAEAGNRIADDIEAARAEYVKNLRAAAGLGDAVPLPSNADAYAGGLRRAKEIARGET